MRPTWAPRIAHEFESQGFDTYLPTFRERLWRTDRYEWIERQYFPGYLFARAPRERIRELEAVTGVIRILPTMTRPVAIPETEMENLRRAIASPLAKAPCSYTPGAKVTVVSGPLRGVEGTVVRSAPGRLIVGVPMMGRGLSVEIGVAEVSVSA